MRPGTVVRAALAGLTASALAGGLAAQVDSNAYWRWRYGNYPFQPDEQREPPPDAFALEPEYTSPLSPPLEPQQSGFLGLSEAYPNFAPRYPRGYPAGAEPRIGGFLPTSPTPPPLTGVPGVPAPVVSRRGWPSWISAEIAEDGRAATPDRAVLVRHADRVWILEADEPAFVPLAFYDKFRLVESGAVVEVRNRGEFQVVFHDGSSVRGIGASRLALPRIEEGELELRLENFLHLWVQVTTRPTRIVLPDGSVLSLQDTSVYLEREYDRGLLFTHGPQPVRWEARSGTIDVVPARKVEFFFDPADGPYLGARLQLEGAVDVDREGRALVARGGSGGGHVTWNGARIAVPPGAVLRIDPMAGPDFPENRR